MPHDVLGGTVGDSTSIEVRDEGLGHTRTKCQRRAQLRHRGRCIKDTAPSSEHFACKKAEALSCGLRSPDYERKPVEGRLRHNDSRSRILLVSSASVLAVRDPSPMIRTRSLLARGCSLCAIP